MKNASNARIRRESARLAKKLSDFPVAPPPALGNRPRYKISPLELLKSEASK